MKKHMHTFDLYLLTTTTSIASFAMKKTRREPILVGKWLGYMSSAVIGMSFALYPLYAADPDSTLIKPIPYIVIGLLIGVLWARGLKTLTRTIELSREATVKFNLSPQFYALTFFDSAIIRVPLVAILFIEFIIMLISPGADTALRIMGYTTLLMSHYLVWHWQPPVSVFEELKYFSDSNA